MQYVLRAIELPLGANKVDVKGSFIPVTVWRKETAYNVYSTAINWRLQSANTLLDVDSVDPVKMLLGRGYLPSFANSPSVDMSGFEVPAGVYYIIQCPNANLLALDHVFLYLERVG